MPQNLSILCHSFLADVPHVTVVGAAYVGGPQPGTDSPLSQIEKAGFESCGTLNALGVASPAALGHHTVVGSSDGKVAVFVPDAEAAARRTTLHLLGEAAGQDKTLSHCSLCVSWTSCLLQLQAL